ncbi:MAG TPA: hypothetical protein VFY51_08660 [Pyrinomonadaceae bacterium]|nr:hypothetical protein [Pyrinomonadaceae bacterium]
MPPPSEGEQIFEDDVNYGIADCRRRLRSQRSTLRAHIHPPTQMLDESSLAKTHDQLEEREEALIT